MGSTRCHWLEGLVVAMHHLNEAGLSQLPSEGSRCTTSADGYALASTSTAVRESSDIAHRLASTSPSSLLVSQRPEDLNKAQPTARRPPRPLVRPFQQPTDSRRSRTRTHSHTQYAATHIQPFTARYPFLIFSLVSGIPAVPPISVRSSDRVRQIVYHLGFRCLAMLVD